MSATDAARKTFCRIDKATKALHPDVRPWDSPSAPAWERAAYALAVEMEQAEYRAREQEALYAQLATAADSLAPRPASQSPLGAAEERFCGARP